MCVYKLCVIGQLSSKCWLGNYVQVGAGAYVSSCVLIGRQLQQRVSSRTTRRGGSTGVWTFILLRGPACLMP